MIELLKMSAETCLLLLMTVATMVASGAMLFGMFSLLRWMWNSSGKMKVGTMPWRSPRDRRKDVWQ